MGEKFVYDKSKLPRPVLEGHDEWIKLYYKAWELAFRNVEYLDRPGWKDIMTCMPGVGIIWQWDSCVMTFITNYSNGTLNAFNNLDDLYMLRRESDGFMSMAYVIETGEPAYGERINPPLMAWAEWEHYRITGDGSRLGRVLPALEGIYSFIENKRRRDTCDLYWFEDPGSSGMDNSPRGGYFARHLDGSDVCHVDLACQQALSADRLGKICDFLGLPEKAEFYRKEKDRINALINEFHWSHKAGWYFDFFSRDERGQRVKLIGSKTAAAFWALLGGAADHEKRSVMRSHMFDPGEFFTKIPFASLSRDDLNYDPAGGYWLGGVWPPTNYAAVRGLCETGSRELARAAVVRVLEGMAAVMEDPAYGGIWECYAPEEYRPSTTEDGGLVRSEFVGWGGLAPITMLIENVIGLHFDAPSDTVTFNLDGRERCGLENVIFNGNTLSVRCAEYQSFRDKTVIETEAEKPFRLRVNTKYLWDPVLIDVPAGKSVFRV